MKAALSVVALLLIAVVSSVPVAQDKQAASAHEQANDEVQQLDQLRKKPSSNGVSFVKTQETHISTVNGKTEGSGNKKETVKEIGTDKTLASVKQSVKVNQDEPAEKPHVVSQTQVDIPSLGIHRTKVDDSDNFHQGDIENQKKSLGYPWLMDDSDRSEDYLSKFSGIQYTPADLAEYILRTGDEEGVALAVEELLRQGLMTREEAIAYLQDVREEMNYLRVQYEKLRRVKELREAVNMKRKEDSLFQQSQLRQNVIENKERFLKKPQTSHEKPPSKTPAAVPTTGAPPKGSSSTKAASVSPTAPPKKHFGPLSLEGGEQLNELEMQAREQQDPGFQPDVDIAAILEKLKSANSLYEEYTLEEIIYWLAKDMLAHSFAKGDQSAEEALARFASFVENEVAQNKISNEVQKKVLDIMLAALVDILREFPNAQYTGSNQLVDGVPRGPIDYVGFPNRNPFRENVREAKRNNESEKKTTSEGPHSSGKPDQRKPATGKPQKS